MKSIGIIGAMEVEVKELREMMENPQAQVCMPVNLPTISS